MDDVRTISILGATGSVGCSTVDLVLSQPEKFDVQAVTCNSNVSKLAEQAISLKARKAVTADPARYGELRDLLSGTGIEVAAGDDAIIDAAAQPADWIMAAIMGFAGLKPIMKAVEQGTCVAIANKEPLVAAGPFVQQAARRCGTTLLPVDSEHNAIFQVFDDKARAHITRLILTASGGPFRTRALSDMKTITPSQAVAHPNWSMGAKISVDSATMMNKALEVIEAHYLFDMPPEKIDVLIHPQSIIHSFVEYSDGSLLAQLGAPDMRTPIAYALAWPERMPTTGLRLDLTKAMSLDLQPLDNERFPAVSMAYDCLRSGLWASVAFNAANEVAVAAFLKEKIGFLDITGTIQAICESTSSAELTSIDDVIAFDGAVRERTSSYIAGNNTDIMSKRS